MKAAPLCLVVLAFAFGACVDSGDTRCVTDNSPSNPFRETGRVSICGENGSPEYFWSVPVPNAGFCSFIFTVEGSNTFQVDNVTIRDGTYTVDRLCGRPGERYMCNCRPGTNAQFRMRAMQGAVSNFVTTRYITSDSAYQHSSSASSHQSSSASMGAAASTSDQAPASSSSGGSGL